MADYRASEWRERWDYCRLAKDTKFVRANAVGPEYVCTGVPISADGEFLQPDSGTMEKVYADARLIAAAPDILRELRALADYCNRDADTRRADMGWVRRMAAAKAAIDKATQNGS